MHGVARIYSRGLHHSSVGDVMQTPHMSNATHSPHHRRAAAQTRDEADQGR